MSVRPGRYAVDIKCKSGKNSQQVTVPGELNTVQIQMGNIVCTVHSVCVCMCCVCVCTQCAPSFTST